MNEENDYRLTLAFLGMVFIEIRGSDNVRTMKFLADVCHNVPAMMATGRSQEDILSQILRVAERYNSKPNIKRYVERVAEQKLLPLKWPED